MPNTPSTSATCCQSPYCTSAAITPSTTPVAGPRYGTKLDHARDEADQQPEVQPDRPQAERIQHAEHEHHAELPAQEGAEHQVRFASPGA